MKKVIPSADSTIVTASNIPFSGICDMQQMYVSPVQELIDELLEDQELRQALVSALAKELREELSPLLKALK